MTYPTITPKLTLDFANSRQLDPRITFSRSSTATYLHPDTGLVTTAPSGVARFEKEGFLIEESRTNTLTHSAEFDNAAWTTADSSITANALTSPDGTLTADKLVENTANGDHAVFDTTPVVKANPSFSCFVKAAGRNFINLRLIRSTYPDRAYATFDLSDGSVTDQGTIGTFFTGVQVRSESVGNSWYRVSISVSSTSTTVRVTLDLSDAAVPTRTNGAPVYQGDGTSGVYIWGAQVEVGSFPTSYIPTSGSTVTRSADVASMTGTDFSSWHNQSEGTLLIQASNVKEAKYCGALTSGTTGTPDTLAIYRKDDDEWRIYHTAQVTFNATGDTANVAMGYSVDGTTRTASAAWQGTLVSSVPTDSSHIDFTRLQLGTGPKGSGYSNGHTSRITYYDRRVSDAELETLTS